MTKKLTLTMDEDVIRKAKRLAAEQNTSVSAMFCRFVQLLGEKNSTLRRVGRLTQQATGVIVVPVGMTDRELLEAALFDKYGGGRAQDDRDSA